MSGEVIGVAASGKHKEQALQPFLNAHGLYSQWLKIERDIPEIETRDPKKILGGKLTNNAIELADTLRFMAEFGLAPHFFSVFDVLGLRVDPHHPNMFDFGSSAEVLKKPEHQIAVKAVSGHFTNHLNGANPKDGWYRDAYVAGAAMARVKHGHIFDEKGRIVWDRPVIFGYSMALAEALADEERLTRLLDKQIIKPDVISEKSIVGLRAQHLPSCMNALGKEVKGAQLLMQYGKEQVTIGAETELSSCVSMIAVATAVTANASAYLAHQMAGSVQKMM